MVSLVITLVVVLAATGTTTKDPEALLIVSVTLQPGADWERVVVTVTVTILVRMVSRPLSAVGGKLLVETESGHASGDDELVLLVLETVLLNEELVGRVELVLLLLETVLLSEELVGRDELVLSLIEALPGSSTNVGSDEAGGIWEQ
jgi:hypothetical protein